MKDALADRAAARSTLMLLVVLLALAVAPHARHLGAWLTGFFFALTAWRLAAVRHPALLPGRWLLLGLVPIGLAMVVLDAGVTLDGRRGGVALLVAMLGLKLLETRSLRDLYMAVFLGYFVVVTQFLFDQSLWIAAYLAVVVVGLTTVLNALSRASPDPPLRLAARQALGLLLAAVPAMTVLFLVFPRLGSPLWSFGPAENLAVTGVSDRMSPGSIGQIARSDAVAFRVRFEGEAPPPAERYWRGPVLWHTDGRTWERGEPVQTLMALPLTGDGEALRYELTLEPTRQHWLFPLELPTEVPDGGRMGRDGVMTVHEPLDNRFTYRGASRPNARVADLSEEERAQALQSPDNVTDRMRALAEAWRNQSEGAEDIVAAALAHYRHEPFVYTLQPRALGNRPDDEFLFETRRGFCEHYASSFVLLMRLAGLPARVVTGYQGGEYNPRGGHFIVRQHDAHAWAEVWMDAKGWQRVDPTSAVAPERIENSIAPQAATAGAPVVFRIAADGTLFGLIREARWLLDSVELGWHRWVIGFNEARQRDLFAGMGLAELRGYGQALAAIGVAAVALLAGAFALRLRLPRRGRRDPVRASYDRLRRKLSRAGLGVLPSQGPRDLERAAARAFPEKALELRRIIGLYVRLRYAGEGSPAQLRQLRRAVRTFKLGRAKARSGTPARAATDAA